jgi:hypothetical protein
MEYFGAILKPKYTDTGTLTEESESCRCLVPILGPGPMEEENTSKLWESRDAHPRLTQLDEVAVAEAGLCG